MRNAPCSYNFFVPPSICVYCPQRFAHQSQRVLPYTLLCMSDSLRVEHTMSCPILQPQGDSQSSHLRTISGAPYLCLHSTNCEGRGERNECFPASKKKQYMPFGCDHYQRRHDVAFKPAPSPNTDSVQHYTRPTRRLTQPVRSALPTSGTPPHSPPHHTNAPPSHPPINDTVFSIAIVLRCLYTTSSLVKLLMHGRPCVPIPQS